MLDKYLLIVLALCIIGTRCGHVEIGFFYDSSSVDVGPIYYDEATTLLENIKTYPGVEVDYLLEDDEDTNFLTFLDHDVIVFPEFTNGQFPTNRYTQLVDYLNNGGIIINVGENGNEQTFFNTITGKNYVFEFTDDDNVAYLNENLADISPYLSYILPEFVNEGRSMIIDDENSCIYNQKTLADDFCKLFYADVGAGRIYQLAYEFFDIQPQGSRLTQYSRVLNALILSGVEPEITFTVRDILTDEEILDNTIDLFDEVVLEIEISPPPLEAFHIQVQSLNENLIEVSNHQVTFGIDQDSRRINLRSPATGKVGTTTILLVPDLDNDGNSIGLYDIERFDMTVIGSMSGTVLSNCVEVGRPNTVEITIDPPAPRDITLTVSTTNGIVSSNTITILNGYSTGTVDIQGGILSTTTIVVTSDLYRKTNIQFNMQGSFTTTQPTSVLEDAPQEISVTVNPAATFAGLTVSFDSENLHVTDVIDESVAISSFDLPRNTNSFQLETTATSPAGASITFSAPNYCPLTVDIDVIDGLFCDIGFTTNIFGDSCALCPGNIIDFESNVVTNAFNSCNLRGDCTFSRCLTSNARCDCESPFVGSSCQFDPTNPVNYFSTFDIPNQNSDYTLSVPDFSQVQDEEATFTFPRNFLSNSLSSLFPLTTFIAPFNRNFPFFGSVDPLFTTPENKISTDVGFYLEFTCFDNSPISTLLNNAAIVNVEFDRSVVSSSNLHFTELLFWNGTAWIDSTILCINEDQDTDFIQTDFASNSVDALVCATGLYNFFIAPPVKEGDGSGADFTFLPPEFISGGKPADGTTGITGTQNKPQEEQPIFSDDGIGDPSDRKPFYPYSSDSSSLLVNLSLLSLIALFLLSF